MSVSVVVTTYKRYDSLNDILRAWLSQKHVTEVILANGGKFFKTELPIKQHLFTPDYGNKIRFFSARLCENDFIILADDDIIPKEGLVSDMLDAQKQSNSFFVGVMGKRFDADEYMDCSHFRADAVDKITNVDFVGVCYLTHSSVLNSNNFNPLHIPHRAIDDLFFQCNIFKQVKKSVLKTDKYLDKYPECEEEGSISKDADAKNIRWKYFKEVCLEV